VLAQLAARFELDRRVLHTQTPERFPYPCLQPLEVRDLEVFVHRHVGGEDGVAEVDPLGRVLQKDPQGGFEDGEEL